ncbi:MAG: cytochrome c biogenesis protein CcsA [Pseudomonadales bacterium]|nr:cytochrome c biogenesis protein CcsA [Pseudomonadales bacterium]
MNAAIFGVLACLLYLGGAGTQLAGLRNRISSQHLIVLGAGINAIIMHALFSYSRIVTNEGINMGILPMASVISLAVAAIVVAGSMKRQVDSLVIAIFPIAAITIIATLVADSSYTPRHQLGGGIVLHIILSVLAYGLLSVAALQAILLSFGDYELKNRKRGLLKHIPPLQTMESLLFELLWAGLILLTLSIISGFIFIGDTSNPGLIHHTSITLAAWIVFSILLWGRYQLGWRGATASRWTLTGFALLLLGYFGSKLVLEIILGRV